MKMTGISLVRWSAFRRRHGLSHADAQRDKAVRSGVRVGKRESTELGLDRFGHPQRATDIGVGQDDGELLAAVAGGQVFHMPNRPADRVGHQLEAAIAGLVAVPVVILLEVIDIAQQQAEDRALGLRPLQVQILIEAATVGDLG